MRKYQTDAYHLVTFDEFGQKLSLDVYGDGFIRAEARGEELVASGDAASYAILRVIRNSKETAAAWEARDAGKI